jgi:hypothetical protein
MLTWGSGTRHLSTRMNASTSARNGLAATLAGHPPHPVPLSHPPSFSPPRPPLKNEMLNFCPPLPILLLLSDLLPFLLIPPPPPPQPPSPPLASLPTQFPSSRGAALEGLGRVEESLGAFQTALSMDPGNQELVQVPCSACNATYSYTYIYIYMH